MGTEAGYSLALQIAKTFRSLSVDVKDEGDRSNQNNDLTVAAGCATIKSLDQQDVALFMLRNGSTRCADSLVNPECEGEISKARREALPFTVRCKTCADIKQRAEKKLYNTRLK